MPLVGQGQSWAVSVAVYILVSLAGLGNGVQGQTVAPMPPPLTAPPAQADNGRLRANGQSLDFGKAPRLTHTRLGIPGDPINVALVGTEDQLLAAMAKAGWLPADPITLRSSMRIVADTVFRRPYPTAPVSNLYLGHRKEDLAFEQAVGNTPRSRHHIRFWQAEQVDARGRPIWLGAATLDTRVEFSHRTGLITHRIGPAVDQERDKLLQDLRTAGVLESCSWLDRFHEKCQGRNGGGDPYFTDGRLGVGVLVSREP